MRRTFVWGTLASAFMWSTVAGAASGDLACFTADYATTTINTSTQSKVRGD